MSESHIIFCNKCGITRNFAKEERTKGTAFIEIPTRTNRETLHMCIECWDKFEATLVFKPKRDEEE